MNNLESICTKVWETTNIEEKKELLKQAVQSFRYKEKVAAFNRTIASCTNANILDKMASNLILNTTDKVVDLLPR